MSRATVISDDAALVDAETIQPSNIPYRSRPLPTKERSSNELYVFSSPRNARVATIKHTLDFAVALTLEFDPTVVAYVERPCVLILTQQRHLECSFWVRRRSGQERILLAIPAALSVLRGSQLAPKDDLIAAAAERQGLAVDFVFEQQILHRGVQIANFLRLLPLVQSAGRIECRGIIRDHILMLLGQRSAVTIKQVIEAIKPFPAIDVRTVIASMLHDGSAQLVHDNALSLKSLVAREKLP